MFLKHLNGNKKKKKKKKKYVEDIEISKLDRVGKSCKVLKIRLMHKLAICHMHFISQIYVKVYVYIYLFFF